MLFNTFFKISKNVKKRKQNEQNLKSTLLATLLSNTLMAEVVFDLGAQQLSNAQDGIYKVSSYDLGKSIVATGMVSNDGVYTPKDGKAGSISVKIKEPKKNWGVTFSMNCYLSSDGCGVTLLGADGSSINATMEWDFLTLDNNRTDIPNHGFRYSTTINGSIQQIKDSDKISINVNGYQHIVSKPGFQLGHVSVSVSGVENGHSDNITSLAIASSDD